MKCAWMNLHSMVACKNLLHVLWLLLAADQASNQSKHGLGRLFCCRQQFVVVGLRVSASSACMQSHFV